MKKFNLMKEYNEAKAYIVDICEYDVETVVSCYMLYKAMRRLPIERYEITAPGDFVIRRFLVYLRKNGKKKNIRMLRDYYFEKLSYNELAKKYNISVNETRNIIKETIRKLNKVYTTDYWFIISQRRELLKVRMKAITRIEEEYIMAKPIDEWKMLEDMNLKNSILYLLNKAKITNVEELIQLYETDENKLRKILGRERFLDVLVKIMRYKKVKKIKSGS